ncbi:hypothetical protein Tco_0655971 [Tanacetum coccineum]|uniref:Uncharacterized protein n=1 Tax=Tanacetum coccineum TaxID=301880 RepID=A0ABQ4X7H3_9ASTR
MEKGRNTYARALIEVSADKELVDSLVVAIPFPNRKGHSLETIEIDEPTNGSNEDITNHYECEQTLDVSAGTLNLSAVKCKAGSKVVPSVDKTTTSQQELELLFSPMYEEYFNARNPSVSKSSALYDNLQQHDTQPTTNSHPTLEPINPPTNVNAEKNMLGDGCLDLVLNDDLSLAPSDAIAQPSPAIRVSATETCGILTDNEKGTASAAAKPCQEDSYEFYLITGSIYTD